MRKLTNRIIIFALMLAITLTFVPAFGNSTAYASQASLSAFEREASWAIVRHINTYRTTNGRTSLPASNTLMEGAATRAREVFANVNLGHNRPDGRPAITAASDLLANTCCTVLGGEILRWTANQPNSEQTASNAITWWSNSPGHRSTMLQTMHVDGQHNGISGGRIGAGHFGGTSAALFGFYSCTTCTGTPAATTNVPIPAANPMNHPSAGGGTGDTGGGTNQGGNQNQGGGQHNQFQRGWVLRGSQWFYILPNGMNATGWLLTGGTWYFMNQAGVMQTGWVQSGGLWYFLRPNGAMATGWVQTGGLWYFLRANGAMATGWVQTGGLWYFLQSNGAMATGWILDGGVWYYLRANGSMVANGVHNAGGARHRFGPSGAWLGAA